MTSKVPPKVCISFIRGAAHKQEATFPETDTKVPIRNFFPDLQGNLCWDLALTAILYRYYGTVHVDKVG